MPFAVLPTANGHTRTHTDATKRIISAATRSIKIGLQFQGRSNGGGYIGIYTPKISLPYKFLLVAY